MLDLVKRLCVWTSLMHLFCLFQRDISDLSAVFTSTPSGAATVFYLCGRSLSSTRNTFTVGG